MEGAASTRILQRSEQQLLGRDCTRWQRRGDLRRLKRCLMGMSGALKRNGDKRKNRGLFECVFVCSFLRQL